MVAVSCGVRCRCCSDPVVLWLWCRLAAAAPIRPLAWEHPYAAGGVLKRQKKKKKKEKKEKCQQGSGDGSILQAGVVILNRVVKLCLTETSVSQPFRSLRESQRSRQREQPVQRP